MSYKVTINGKVFTEQDLARLHEEQAQALKQFVRGVSMAAQALATAPILAKARTVSVEAAGYAGQAEIEALSVAGTYREFRKGAGRRATEKAALEDMLEA